MILVGNTYSLQAGVLLSLARDFRAAVSKADLIDFSLCTKNLCPLMHSGTLVSLDSEHLHA